MHPGAQMTFENKRERIPRNLACSAVTAAARRSQDFSAGAPLHSFWPRGMPWSEVRACSQVREERGPGGSGAAGLLQGQGTETQCSSLLLGAALHKPAAVRFVLTHHK